MRYHPRTRLVRLHAKSLDLSRRQLQHLISPLSHFAPHRTWSRESSHHRNCLRRPRHGRSLPHTPARLQHSFRKHAFCLPPRNDVQLHCPHFASYMVLRRFPARLLVDVSRRILPAHNRQMDALALVRARRNRDRNLTRIPLATGSDTDDLVRISRSNTPIHSYQLTPKTNIPSQATPSSSPS